MIDTDPARQITEALTQARRRERSERDENVADELEQTDRIVDSIDGSIDADEPEED